MKDLGVIFDSKLNFVQHCKEKINTAYYAALLPRRGPHIASHSVCLSVRLSVRPVIERHVAPPSELQ